PPIHISTLSLHDALPISPSGDVPKLAVVRAFRASAARLHGPVDAPRQLRVDGLQPDPRAGFGLLLPGPGGDADPRVGFAGLVGEDRKSTRLNSSHVKISY